MVKSTVADLKQLIAGGLGYDDFEIVDTGSRLLTPPGEHYGSIMLALDVTVKRPKVDGEEIHNLVAKLIPANEMLRLAFNIDVTFKKEVNAYTEAIPALVDFQREHRVPEERLLSHIFPRCYGARISLDPEKGAVDQNAAIIFENLKVQGYETADRMVGFDLETAELIVKDLAKFHGVPLAMRRLRPALFAEKIGPSLVKNTGLEVLPPEVGAAFHDTIMETAQQIPELAPYLERVRKVVETAERGFFKEKPPPNDLLATLTHSDYWVSNTMILRSQSGEPLKNKMVDLQITTYNSAVRDLVFFLFTSVMNRVLAEHCDHLIRLYHSSLVDVLADYDIDVAPYAWPHFVAELELVAPTEAYHILVMLKPICTERGMVNNLEDFRDTDWSRKELLGPTHRRKLRDTVIALAGKNWI